MEIMGLRSKWKITDQENRLKETNPEVQRVSDKLGVSKLVATILIKRGFGDEEKARTFLRPSLKDLYDPSLLPGTTKAADRLAKAIRDKQPVVIYGDYDVDGITATGILWHLLKLAGGNVSTYVPHRIDEGYGLNVQAIEQLSENKPVIVSVDCGITAVEPALKARQLGVDLIITDHHEFDDSEGSELPEAYALVHPGLDGGRYPFRDLSGAGVAYKLGWEFARTFCGSDRLPDRFRQMLLDLLAFVALGTVADVVPLVDENRILVTYGLRRLLATPFEGLNALIDASGLRGKDVDSTHVGFVLGPRLNACGRMGHAEEAVRLLTTSEGQEAKTIAGNLSNANDQRRAIEKRTFEQAKQMVAEAGYDSDDHRAIVVGHEDWHPGVVGIVASRMVEKYSRPVVMLCYADGVARGSARSVAGVSIHDVLSECSQLMNSWGGHAMAAGMSLPLNHVDDFRDMLVALVNQRLAIEDLIGELKVDARCGLDELKIEVVEQLQILAPFGRGNEHPVFWIQGVRVDGGVRQVGGEGQHLRIGLRQGQHGVMGVGFGMGQYVEQVGAGTELDAVFEPKINAWRGTRKAELHLKDIRIR